MITSNAFLNEHALSMTSQPGLKTLLDAIRDQSVKVTIVAGAGISINSGLPTWPKLLEEIIEKVDPQFKSLVSRDSSDTLRKAEYALQMAVAAGTADENAIIRDAVYSNGRDPQPGKLATELASLAETLGDRVRFITTNYDTLLEKAMRSVSPTAVVKTYGPSQMSAWEASNGFGPGHVLHVHGVLEPNVPAKGHVVLTESHFLDYGQQVRDVIAKRLETDLVIFIGVSLTDPNLTAPLRALAGKKRTQVGPFVLTVPDIIDASQRDLSVEFAFRKALFLESKLMTTPIFLKSYTQLRQLISELSYAVLDPSSYKPVRGKHPGAYGNRITAALDGAYRSLGAVTKLTDTLPTDAAITLSNSLSDAISRRQPLGKLIHGLAQRPAPFSTVDEIFGLSLWLRARKGRSTHAPYALNLVGNSEYVVRTPAFSTPPVEILGSVEVEAQTIHRGITSLATLTGEKDWPWRGVIALPLEIKENGKTVTVGVVSLRTTRLVHGELANPELSFIRRLDEPALFGLLTAIEQAGQKLIKP